VKIIDEFSASVSRRETAVLKRLLNNLDDLESSARDIGIDLDTDDARAQVLSEIADREDALARRNASDTETAVPVSHAGGGGNAGRTI